MAINASHRVHYSYHTCGEVDRWADSSEAAARLRGMTLRVMVPTVTSPTAHLRSGTGLFLNFIRSIRVRLISFGSAYSDNRRAFN